MNSIIQTTREELRKCMTDHSFPAYRADQILQWVYKHRATDWRRMTNLHADLQQFLSEHFSLRQARLEKKQSAADGAVKILLRWPDDARTETVLIPDDPRRTVCLSTQVGCPVGCAFCASGLTGFERSLAAAEIVEQLLWIQQDLKPYDRISNVVFMGMGEPLVNYENTLQAIRRINADWAFGIGARHITLSTIGLPKQIRRLAHEDLQITLAVSLHAGDDQLRQTLIPWAKQFPLDRIFAAIDYYFQHTRREVTLEYVLLEGVNTSPADADNLARWAHRSRCNVNLINYNPVTETEYSPANAETAGRFLHRLQRRGVNAHLRSSRGADIDAACGQLRRKTESFNSG
jgi:23S rRNA (adenine2503-C2)-methyltransferase